MTSSKLFTQHVEDVLHAAGCWIGMRTPQYAGEPLCRVEYGGRNQYGTTAVVHVVAAPVYAQRDQYVKSDEGNLQVRTYPERYLDNLSPAAALESVVDIVFNILNSDPLCEVETVSGHDEERSTEYRATMMVRRKLTPEELNHILSGTLVKQWGDEQT